MMASTFYRRATALCATRFSSSLFPTAARVVGASAVSNRNAGQLQQYQQQHQVRSAWTKAKKKRFIRSKINEARAARGQVFRPQNYRDPATPVENSIPREEANEALRVVDERDRKILEERRAALMNREPRRHHMTGLSMSDRVARLFDMINGNQMEVVAYQKASGMSLFQLREGDTGSTPVQIVALTARIQQLQTHMKTHKKDFANKRGLLKLTVRRRKLLDYLERKDFNVYRRVVKSLGLARK